MTLGTDCDDDDDAGHSPAELPELGAGQCAPSGVISAGGSVAGDTSFAGGFSADLMDAYPIMAGNYSGREAVYSFEAPGDGEVTFQLVSPDPTEVNHDLIVLEAEADNCAAAAAIDWGFSDVTVDVSEGQVLMLVVDGYAGDEGFYMVSATFDY